MSEDEFKKRIHALKAHMDEWLEVIKNPPATFEEFMEKYTGWQMPSKEEQLLYILYLLHLHEADIALLQSKNLAKEGQSVH